MTAFSSIDSAIAALRKGAYDYITKPFVNEDLLQTVKNALRTKELFRENRALRRELEQKYSFSEIIGNSAAIQAVFRLIEKVSATNTNILIQGESGTGKELVARAIHQLSPLADKSFVAINCGALPESLLESELFGHTKGAFTGAIADNKGLFRAAEGGTLFLDEIGEIDATLQVKLLRFLDVRTFERVGSNKTLTADVRLITATNRDLQAMVKEGEFRQDLYYRLCVVEILLPSLRDRPSDIHLLATSFLTESAKANGKPIAGFSSEALDALQAHDWPGNVRELRAAVERAVVLSRDPIIGLRDLPPDIRQPRRAPTTDASDTRAPIHTPEGTTTVHDAERNLIIEALRETGGNRTEAARRIGLSRRTLHRKLHEYHLEGF